MLERLTQNLATYKELLLNFLLDELTKPEI